MESLVEKLDRLAETDPNPITLRQLKFKQENKVVEHKLSFLIHHFKEGSFTSPTDENGPVDSVRNGTEKMQYKAARPRPRCTAGVRCESMHRSGGWTVRGKRLHVPYAEGEVDRFIFGYVPGLHVAKPGAARAECKCHLWDISEDVMIAACRVGPKAITSLTLHVWEETDGIVPIRDLKRKTTYWTRRHHTEHPMTEELWAALDSGAYLEELVDV